jgi:hypothetical protein
VRRLPIAWKSASPVFMNEFALTAPKPKGLPRPLAKRSAIDPFIVMDVMREANAPEMTAGLSSILPADGAFYLYADVSPPPTAKPSPCSRTSASQ